METFILGGVDIPPGERATIELPLARLYTVTDTMLPVHVVRGRRDGPRLLVCAALHGDEINGVETIRRLLRLKLLRRLHGTLIAVPVVNVYGFLNRSRYLPDRRDLNRSFPGSTNGSLASSLARTFMDEVVDHATHVVDLHTGSNGRTNLPQVRAAIDDEETARLAKIFGAPVIIDAKLREGSLRAAVSARSGGAQGVPMLLYEAGEAQRFDETAIRVGLRGVLATMRALEMLPRPAIMRAALGPLREPLIARSSTWMRAPRSGMLHAPAALGANVKQGERIGAISDPFSQHEEPVVATISGIVIGRLNVPLVHRGDALFHIASLEAGGVQEIIYEEMAESIEFGDEDTVE